MFRSWLVVVVLFGACGKSAAPADVAPTSASEAPASDAAAPSEEVAVEDGAVNEEVAGEGDPVSAALERVSKLEVPGMTRSRAQLASGYVTVAFESAVNAKGNAAMVELTVSACKDCARPAVADIEAHKQERQDALGELHAKNPKLVFTIAPLELMPERTGVEVYARSVVVDDATHAVLHTLEVNFVDNGFAFRFFAYPQSGMANSDEELVAAYSQAELEANVKALFVATSAALWPPTP